MSTVDTTQRDWTNISDQKLDSKYEKCRNITEEIYKRINITFQIKKLEAGQSELSDNSDQIDSNELSNETDLFACDKSDLTSSSEAEKPPTDCGKFVNINNNEEKNKMAPVPKRPKKRLRKRVKKRQVRARSDSEGSSDEAPLSRIADAPVSLTQANINDTALKSKLDKKPIEKDVTKKNAAKTPQKFPIPTTDKKNIDLSSKTVSVRIDKLPIPNVMLSMNDTLSVKNYKLYRSYMKNNKLTIKNVFANNPSQGKLSMKTDKLSMKEDKEARKCCSLTSAKCRHSPREYKCPLCDKTYSSKSGLHNHHAVAHARTSIYCAFCRKYFRTTAGLTHHLRTNSAHTATMKEKYVCDYCGATYLKKPSLREHIEWYHLKIVRFKRPKCSKASHVDVS